MTTFTCISSGVTLDSCDHSGSWWGFALVEVCVCVWGGGGVLHQDYSLPSFSKAALFHQVSWVLMCWDIWMDGVGGVSVLLPLLLPPLILLCFHKESAECIGGDEGRKQGRKEARKEAQ